MMTLFYIAFGLFHFLSAYSYHEKNIRFTVITNIQKVVEGLDEILADIKNNQYQNVNKLLGNLTRTYGNFLNDQCALDKAIENESLEHFNGQLLANLNQIRKLTKSEDEKHFEESIADTSDAAICELIREHHVLLLEHPVIGAIQSSTMNPNTQWITEPFMNNIANAMWNMFDNFDNWFEGLLCSIKSFFTSYL